MINGYFLGQFEVFKLIRKALCMVAIHCKSMAYRCLVHSLMWHLLCTISTVVGCPPKWKWTLYWSGDLTRYAQNSTWIYCSLNSLLSVLFLSRNPTTSLFYISMLVLCQYAGIFAAGLIITLKWWRAKHGRVIWFV